MGFRSGSARAYYTRYPRTMRQRTEEDVQANMVECERLLVAAMEEQEASYWRAVGQQVLPEALALAPVPAAGHGEAIQLRGLALEELHKLANGYRGEAGVPIIVRPVVSPISRRIALTDGTTYFGQPHLTFEEYAEEANHLNRERYAEKVRIVNRVAKEQSKATARKRGSRPHKLPTVASVVDFDPIGERVVRRGNGTFIVNREGVRADMEVESDVLTPEREANLWALTPMQQVRMGEEIRRTSLLSPEGKTERLVVLAEIQGVPEGLAARPTAAEAVEGLPEAEERHGA